MDQSVPNMQPTNQPQPAETAQEPTKQMPIKNIAGVIAIIVVLLLAGVVLIKGFPEAKKLPTATLRPSPTPIVLPCPSVAAFCTNPKEVVKDGKSIGIGNTIPKDSPVYAVFDGTIVARTQYFAGKDAGKKFYNVTLTNDASKVQAIYVFGNYSPITGNVTKGSIIGHIGESISYNDGHNLVFNLLDTNGRVLKEYMVFQK